MKNLWHKRAVVQLSDAAVPQIADGAIATVALGEGSLLPLLILDTSKRPDIEDMVKAQGKLPPGDVTSQWGSVFNLMDTISLILQFQRPSKVSIIIHFDVIKQGILIDQILKLKAVYLQPGRIGDKLSKTMDKPKILVEVPDLGFQNEWKEIWSKSLARMFKKKGLQQQDATSAANTVINKMQASLDFRMGH